LEQYLTISKTAQLLGVSERTVRRFAKKGLLNKVKVKGKVYFLEKEVTQLDNTRSEGGRLGIIYTRLQELTKKNTILEARVRVLELALSSRQEPVSLGADDIKTLKKAISTLIKNKHASFSDVVAWSDDLLRLSRDCCKKIGLKKLETLSNKLILIGDEAQESLRDASKSIYVDKIIIFKDRINKFKKT